MVFVLCHNRMYRLLWRWLSLAAGLWLACVSLSLASAQAALDVQVVPAFEGNYLPGTWLPLDIALRNEGTGFDALIAAALPNSPDRYTLLVDLPGGAEKRVTLYVPMLQETRAIRLSIERDGSPLFEQEVEVRPRPGERLLGIAAAQPLPLNLPLRQAMQAGQMPFVSFALPLETLPDQAMGLRSLTLLLIASETQEALSAAQQQTLINWVAGGGHLVLAGGPAAERIIAGLPERLRPATIGEPLELDTQQLATFAAAEEPASLPGVQLQPHDGAAAFGPAAAPLWVQRSLGNGLMTQLAFDPALPALQTWPGAPGLWDRLLQPALLVPSLFSTQTSLDISKAQTLTSAAINIPALNLPPTVPLFAVLAAYVVIIGPGVMLLLSRRNQQVWGWLIIPALALVFGLLGFALALTSRADERIVSQVSLVEQIDEQQALVRSVVAFLAPQEQEIALHVPPQALLRPSFSVGSSLGEIFSIQGQFSQQSGSTTLQGQRWLLEGMNAEQYIALPQLDAQIILDGQQIRAHVRNTTDWHLRDVSVVYRRQVAHIGELAPGAEGSAPWPSTINPRSALPPPGAPLSALMLGEALRASRSLGDLPDRRLLAREQLVNAAAVSGSELDDNRPLVLAWPDQNPLPVLPAEPGAATRQTTLLVARPTIQGSGPVILPRDWLYPAALQDGRAVCVVGQARGIALQPVPVTLTLSLPPDLRLLQATALTLTLESERTWPNTGVALELFDWQAEEWKDMNYDGPGDLPLDDPAPYLQNGLLRLRLSGRIDEGRCLLLGTQLAGELP